MTLEEQQEEERKQIASTSYLKAYKDLQFLGSPACRGIRLALEFLKPDLTMNLNRIESTLVIFGSARILPIEEAEKRYHDAKLCCEKYPYASELTDNLKKAERLLELSRYYQVARELGRLVTNASRKLDGHNRTFVVTTGGGGGIMEAGNRGASEAGGLTIGVNISLPFEQRPNPYISPELTFNLHYFNIRKMHFLQRAKALACFPGGYGTMDELFEVLTLVQTKKIAPMPVLLYGKKFWESLINWNLMVDEGLILAEDLQLFKYCETAQEGWDIICDFYGYPKEKQNEAEPMK